MLQATLIVGLKKKINYNFSINYKQLYVTVVNLTQIFKFAYIKINVQ